MSLILCYLLYILPTAAVLSLLKAVKDIVEKRDSASWIFYGIISGVCLTFTAIAIAYLG